MLKPPRSGLPGPPPLGEGRGALGRTTFDFYHEGLRKLGGGVGEPRRGCRALGASESLPGHTGPLPGNRPHGLRSATAEQSRGTHQKHFLQGQETLTFGSFVFYERVPYVQFQQFYGLHTLKEFKLYKYHAKQTNYKTEKKIKLVGSTSLTCLISLE